MLLRSVIRHVGDQNWLAVFIDFCIVVVGIFVALQVQAWNVERDERKQERLYLERILADVELSITANQQILGLNSGPRDNIWMAFQSLRDCELAEDDRDRFALAMFRIGRYVPTNYLMGTADEMRSAGLFRLITDTDIKDQINQLNELSNLDRSLLPEISRRASHATAYVDQSIVINKEKIGLFGGLGWKDVLFDFDSACQDTKLLASISLVRGIREIYISRNEAALRSFEEIRERLLRELANPKQPAS